MDENILIKNAKIVDEGSIVEGDVLIRKGIIERIDPSISLPVGTRLILADNQYLLPGAIDTHVHFRDPGLTDKADFATESAAAVAGGVTSVIDMPNTLPPALTPELLEEKFGIAAQKSSVNYSFMIGASERNLEDILRADPARVAAVKVFFGSSTGDMALKGPEAIERLFVSSPLLIAAHCEDDARIAENLAKARKEFGEDIPPAMHARIRDEEACLRSSSAAIDLAKKTGARLHLLHVSSACELNQLSSMKPGSYKKITAEVCTHHLFFDERDYATLGNLIKVNPSVKSEKDRQALWEALLSGRIDTIGSDHAPHTAEEKARPYLRCPSGGPMIQHTLPAMLSEVVKGHITLEQVVEKMCHNPARIFQIERRGFLREGYFGDAVLVEFNSPWRVRRESLKYKCGWSAFEGRMFPARITHTLVGGQVAYAEGKLYPVTSPAALTFER